MPEAQTRTGLCPRLGWKMLFVSSGQLPLIARADNRSIKFCFPQGAQREHPRESPGAPGRDSFGFPGQPRQHQRFAQHVSGFRIGLAGLQPLIKITGKGHRQGIEESNDEGIGFHDFLLRLVEQPQRKSLRWWSDPRRTKGSRGKALCPAGKSPTGSAACQMPSARTIGRLMIQPEMQQARRTSSMRRLQK
jgi:hypothetical protein